MIVTGVVLSNASLDIAFHDKNFIFIPYEKLIMNLPLIVNKNKVNNKIITEDEFIKMF
jgi:hypothetical protein